jgi:hypothetical protein
VLCRLCFKQRSSAQQTQEREVHLGQMAVQVPSLAQN